MNNRVVPEMISLARMAADLTQKDLAEILGYSSAKLSKIENGLAPLPESDLPKLAKALGQSPKFFRWRPPLRQRSSEVYHKRAYRSASPRSVKCVDCRIDVLQLRVQALLEGLKLNVMEGGFEPIDIDEFGGEPEEIAQRIRKRWRVRTGPIQDLTDRVERSGGIVVLMEFSSNKDFGRSFHHHPMPAVLVLNRESSADRLRFTLAHEVGHLIMHPDSSSSENAENEADRFAAELLMPAQEITPELQEPLTIQKLANLKRTWQVSMQALIRRAHDLGQITPRRYQLLMMEFSRRGWRKNEPISIEAERPTLLDQVIDYHREKYGRTLDEVAEVAGSALFPFVKQFLPGRTSTRVAP